jgi:hypothetical protein
MDIKPGHFRFSGDFCMGIDFIDADVKSLLC